VNPEAFKIVDEKLYLNWSRWSAFKFGLNTDTKIKKADTNWAKKLNPN
jgi:hypothetical protein